jgi:hypothetical protein
MRPAPSVLACSLEHSPPRLRPSASAAAGLPAAPLAAGGPCRWNCPAAATRQRAGLGGAPRRSPPTSRAGTSAANGDRRSTRGPSSRASHARAHPFGKSRVPPRRNGAVPRHHASRRGGFAASPASATPIGCRPGLFWSWLRHLESLENFQGGAARDRIGARPFSQTVRSQTLVE